VSQLPEVPLPGVSLWEIEMKTRPATEYVLLGALYSGPMHGYEIINFLQKSLGGSWYVSTSQLYTVLKRLEKIGLIKGSLKHQESRPSKRIFSVTQKGKEAFESWTKRPCEHVRDMRVEFLTKLYFVRNHGLPWGKKLIDKQEELLRERQLSLVSLRKKEKDPYLRLICTFKLSTVRVWLTWLNKEARGFATSS